MIKIGTYLKSDDTQLVKEYQLALENDKFQSFVKKLKIDNEILMQYTSLLEESCLEFDHCLNCSNLSECKNKMMGYTYLPKINNNKLQFNYKPCHFKKANDKKFKHLKNVKFFNLNQALKEASWDSIDNRYTKRQETIKWLHNFVNNYPNCDKGLYLNGSFGCGKTYLIVATFNELAKNNVRSAVIFWPEFLRDLKASFDTTFEEKIDYIKKVPLLLIDDLGAEATTSWSRDEILCSILQYRMDEGLKTFITSNLNLINLEQHLAITKDGVEVVKAKRIIERINQLTESIEMISKNMRK
ncbi:MAG: primosomal protein DnaI [Bacilli bacterium]